MVIGSGAVPYLDDFASGYPDTIRFLTDPKRRSFRAMSLQRGMGGVRALGSSRPVYAPTGRATGRPRCRVTRCSKVESS